ncbi:ABC transporter permease [Hoyosella altamirensis]|uniref:Peptide/nickel transport system permease protein n=1 Tax=Hoyosella altamirensis TaxID=616997 RepID=A0A839RKX0_9ACTN|nr:ABC transporter permease [Hoyosella altamirensis]MBB3037027.1 peptide/nickel transport system permease protein [Hoyosella altamirensis]
MIYRLLLRRAALNLLLLALLSVVVFAGGHALPGDPVVARLGPTASPDQIDAARAALGLDQPALTRYGEWAFGLMQGQWGHSITGTPVADMLAERMGNSLLLAGLAMVFLVPASLVLGVLAARYRNSGTDRGISATALVLVSIPEFLTATGLIAVFAIAWPLFPAVSLIPAGSSPLQHPAALVLPVATLFLVGLAYATRVIRANSVAAYQSRSVEYMRLTGAREKRILRTAVLPAVLPTAIQVWLLTGVALVGGAVLVERVFSYPGIGDTLVQATVTGDLPVVQALTLLLAAVMLAALTLGDIAVLLMTPRLRTGLVT